MANRLWDNKKVVLSCKMITTIINIFVIVFCHWQKSVQLIPFNRTAAHKQHSSVELKSQLQAIQLGQTPFKFTQYLS